MYQRQLQTLINYSNIHIHDYIHKKTDLTEIEKEQKIEEIKNESSSTTVSREMKLEFCQKVKNLSNNGLLMLVDKIKEVKA